MLELGMGWRIRVSCIKKFLYDFYILRTFSKRKIRRKKNKKKKKKKKKKTKKKKWKNSLTQKREATN